MEDQKITPINERSEIVQEVVDRLLHLSPDEMSKYKKALERLHTLYKIEMEVKNEVRVYSLNKNLQKNAGIQN
jgi:hypothetical protein